MAPATEEPFFAPKPVELEIAFGAPGQQDRLTVFFRQLLVLPHIVVLGVLGLVAMPLVVVGWFAALVLGRLPRWIAVYLMGLIVYSIRVNSYAFMLAGDFPSFSPWHADYPVAVQIGASRLSRLKVFFRWLLAIPAYIVVGIAGLGLLALSPIIWLITLLRGDMPLPLFGAAAAVIRYQARYSAYMSLVTDRYPRRLFGDDEARGWESEQPGYELRLRLSAGGRRVLALVAGLGIAVLLASFLVPLTLRPAPPPRNPAVVAAERKFSSALIEASADRRCNLRCLQARERALGRAFIRFASSLSHISFPRAQRGPVLVLIEKARRAGHLLLAASKSPDAGRSQGIDPTLTADSLWFDEFYIEVDRVLGPGL